ncbi:hypothetical protein O6H91_12G066700 [Diphasiastrum complanatum]|uniref:Uncharacterized protein n=1 Tax=Diphasiastrum complanatum TaxID=34168 RepID=A0ACC2C2Z2_DIPCM|nr:hypothetical protein O6H91_12G066700 [Diphasiastrum complanatum]
MAVYTFVCRHSKGIWSAKQHGGDASLEGSAATPYELQQKLKNLALSTAGSGSVSIDFSIITPSAAVLQIVIGGGGGGAVFSGGAPAAASAGGATTAAAVEEKEEEKKKDEEESDDDMGFSLFD